MNILKYFWLKAGITTYRLLLLSLFIMFIFSFNAGAITIDPSISLVVDDQTFSVVASMIFSQIDIGSSSIGFNDIYFTVTNPNPIWVNLSYLNGDIENMTSGQIALSFNTESSIGNVSFNLSGFSSGDTYYVYKDGVKVFEVEASGSGIISFYNSVWSDHSFDIIYFYESTPPVDDDDGFVIPVITISNFSYIMSHFMEWSMRGYTIALGFLVWPIIFAALVGYIYMKNTSVIAGAVAIIILFATMATTSWIAEVPTLALFLQVVVVLSITGLILFLLVRRRG